jgi:hypothetical protein
MVPADSIRDSAGASGFGRRFRRRPAASFTIPTLLCTHMGFGSYDESEQGNHGIDTDADDIDGTDRPAGSTHDGEINFEYEDASSEDLFEAYEEFNSQ